MDSKPTKIVACPKCKRSSRFDEGNEFRPFCSKRCKEDDIVSWATESYRVPEKQKLSDDELAAAQSGKKIQREDDQE